MKMDGGRQIGLLFTARLLLFTFGSGSLTFVPLFARQLGASDTLIGTQLAVAFLGLTLGTMVAGWLSDRFHLRKTTLLLVGLCGTPLYFLTAASSEVWELFVLSVVLWYVYGAGFSITYVMGGIAADAAVRGRVYGLLELAAALGGLASGLSFGFILDLWGFSLLFRAVAFGWLLIPIVAIFLVDPQEGREKEKPEDQEGPIPANSLVNKNAALLMISALLINIAAFTGFLSLPLSMDTSGFSGAAIASTNTAGGLILIPVTFLSGSLSDRWGRKPFIIATYLIGAVGALMFATATALWHFWIISGSFYVMQVASRGLGVALLTDLLPRQRLGTGLAVYQAMGWSAAVPGYIGGGFALAALGLRATFAIAATLCLLAALLVSGIRLPTRSSNSRNHQTAH